MSKLLLIDGSGLMHRAFHACRNNPQAVGSRFFSFFRDLVDGENPTHYAVAFDPPRERLYRIGIYPEYKGHRPTTPADQREFFDNVREACREAGIPTFLDPEWEADDLLGTLAQLPADEVVICSSDKDMAQLITDRVTTYDPQQRRRMNATAARAAFGCEISQIPDLLAIEGDRADNIPGMPGVGRRGAQRILEAMGSATEIIDSGFYEGHSDALATYLDLTTIRTDLDHQVQLEDLVVRPIEFQTPSLKAIRAQAAARALSSCLTRKN